MSSLRVPTKKIEFMPPIKSIHDYKEEFHKEETDEEEQNTGIDFSSVIALK